MIRIPIALASITLLAVCAAVSARSHDNSVQVDRVQGVRIASRLPCDGATNPQEDVSILSTFSPGGLQRAFHLDVFESQYCKRLDLYFFCLSHGHDRFKHTWESDSLAGSGHGTFWINSCATWESKDKPEYILSAWYKEGTGKKAPWKQASIKKVSETPEVYEFADSQGGTARVELKYK